MALRHKNELAGCYLEDIAITGCDETLFRNQEWYMEFIYILQISIIHISLLIFWIAWYDNFCKFAGAC